MSDGRWVGISIQRSNRDMRTYLVAALLVLTVGLDGCVNYSGWRAVNGSGNVVTEDRQVSGFDQVSVSGAGELTLTQGDEESLKIETDDNLLPLIESKVHNGVLSIGPREGNLRPTEGIHYQLHLKKLSDLQLSGAVRAEADSIKMDRLGLGISGAAKVSVAHLDTQALSTQISGAGSASATGRAERQVIRITGAGNHHALDLKCAQAEAHVSGAGHAFLWVTESLTAHVSGSGGVEYRGDPRVESHVSGAGRVKVSRQ